MNSEEIESTRLDFLEMNPAGVRRHLQTTKFIKNKKATINPLNNDNECFKCALKIAIHKNELSKSALSKYCNKCYNHFWDMAFLEKHYKVCKDIDSRPAEMPEKDKNDKLNFKKFNSMVMQTFNAEVDFKTYYDEKECEKNNREGKSTTLLGKIKPYSVVLQLNCLYDTKFNE